MFDRRPMVSPPTAAAVDQIRTAARAENAGAGARLAGIGELYALRLQAHSDRVRWALDPTAAVVAEVAAALSIGSGLAASYLYYAQAMRYRLPAVGALLRAGDIGYLLFQAVVHRTDLITDPETLAAVDAELARAVVGWPSMTRSRLNACIDRVVARRDPDAVRRRREARADRGLSIWDSGNGTAEVFGRLISTDAQVVDKRLEAIAGSVCDQDPRTHKQRRADALGALAAGTDRLTCCCERSDCPAGTTPAPVPVVIHVLAEQGTIDGTSDAPAVEVGTNALIPPELLAELAAAAKRRPLLLPVDAAPEPRYRPSAVLADFVRCRDLTCRFPGCDVPASACDLDHTIPYGAGGQTHASNLKAMCRRDHLVKTFWGWKDQQLPDGTVIWTAPTGHTYVTTPGSALLFPQLCTPTGHLDPPEPVPAQPCADRGAMMPTRRRTRAQHRAHYIATERRLNRDDRQARQAARDAARRAVRTARSTPAPAGGDDDPPPF